MLWWELGVGGDIVFGVSEEPGGFRIPCFEPSGDCRSWVRLMAAVLRYTERLLLLSGLGIGRRPGQTVRPVDSSVTSR